MNSSAARKLRLQARKISLDTGGNYNIIYKKLKVMVKNNIIKLG